MSQNRDVVHNIKVCSKVVEGTVWRTARGQHREALAFPSEKHCVFGFRRGGGILNRFGLDDLIQIVMLVCKWNKLVNSVFNV